MGLLDILFDNNELELSNTSSLIVGGTNYLTTKLASKIRIPFLDKGIEELKTHILEDLELVKENDQIIRQYGLV